MHTISAWIVPLLSLLAASTTPGAAHARLHQVSAHFQSADTPAPQSHTPGVVMGSKDERAAKAAAYYAQNRSVEAALGFEGLWRDFPEEPDFLFNASASRYAAGHFAHAVAYSRELVASGKLDPQTRKEAEAQLSEALSQTGTVAVAVDAGAGARSPQKVILVAEFIPRESGDIRPKLLFPAGPGSAIDLQLDFGFWTLRAEADGFLGTEQRIEIVKNQKSAIKLRLSPTQNGAAPPTTPGTAAEVPRAVARRQMLGFGVAGGVVTATGVAVVIAGSVKVGNTASCQEQYEACSQELSRGLTTRAFGTLFLGGGLGLMAGSLPWLARDVRTRRKVWIAEAVVGVAIAAGGIVIARVTGAQAAAQAAEVSRTSGDWKTFYGDYGRIPGHGVGNTLLGFGVGTAVSAVTGMLVQRHHVHKLGLQVSASPRQWGLTLSGRF